MEHVKGPREGKDTSEKLQICENYVTALCDSNTYTATKYKPATDFQFLQHLQTSLQLEKAWPTLNI